MTSDDSPATHDPAVEPELPLDAPAQASEEAELRAAWRTVKRLRGRSFEAAMQIPAIATCIRNIAHARRSRATRKDP